MNAPGPYYWQADRITGLHNSHATHFLRPHLLSAVAQCVV